MAQMDDAVTPEAEFQRKVAPIKSSSGLVLNRSEICLATVDSKPSIFKLEKYLHLCKNKLKLLNKKKEGGFFGAFSNHPELTEIEKSLEETISKLQNAKKDLEDRGHKNVEDLIINSIPDPQLKELFQELKQLSYTE